MNIIAKEGTKVIYTGKNGYDGDKEYANKFLTIGETYTVVETIVHNYSSEVLFKEVPDKYFNTVHFEEV